MTPRLGSAHHQSTPARELRLWEKYSREGVHDIFSPDSKFTPQSGTWGLLGIVPVPGRDGDFVFFVTYGMSQGEHDFDEFISDDGVLTWQSQPKQNLGSRQIRQFIGHDERLNTIHLFLRSKSGVDVPYTYLGPIGYLNHDLDRENPVHFQWQILEWPPPGGVLDSAGLMISHRSEAPLQSVPADQLEITAPPVVRRRGGTTSRGFRFFPQAAHVDRDADNAELGLAGELLVLESERRRLERAGRADLAEKVVHVSVVEGDAAGYDIHSYNLDESPRYLEVKTTRGAATAGFFVSANQIAFSRSHAEHFVLARVYNYSAQINSARCFELSGPLEDHLELAPTEYRATLIASG